jgi:alkaline phosphatase D
MLEHSAYYEFMRTMCPGSSLPAGESCESPILGVYDDHDFGANNGNARLPEKDEYKNYYLDAVGVAPDSPRRGAFRPAYHKYTYASGSPSLPRKVDIFFLDERYDRAPLPCHIRRTWCEAVVLLDPTHKKHGWCKDYTENEGSCCRADDEIAAGICLDASNADDPLFGQACDPAHPLYGTEPLAVVDGRLTDEVIGGERRWNRCVLPRERGERK